MALEDEVRAQTAAIDRLIGTLSGPKAGGGGGSSGGVDMPNVKKVDGFVGTLLNSLGSINKGASASGAALEGFAGFLNKVPIAGQTLSTAFGQYAGVVQDNIAGQKELRNSGISFNNNITDYANTVARSGQTNKEFNRLMGDMAPNMSGLGSVLGSSTKNVAQFNEEFAKSKTGQTLKDMGYNMDEINRFGAISLANSKQRDLTDSKQRAQAVADAETLTKRNLELAQATGKSTDEINRMTLANTASIDIQAEVIAGGPEVQAAYSKILPTLNQLGPTISNMAQEAFTETGIKSEEAGNTQAVLGSAGQQLTEAIQLQKEAAKEGASAEQKRTANIAMERAQAAIDARMMTKEFRDLVQNPQADGGLARKMFQERQQQLGSLQQTQTQLQKQGRPSDVASARQTQRDLTGASMASVDPRTGQRSQGADVISAQNQADIAGRATANAIAIKGITALGDASDKAAGKILKIVGGKTPADIVENPKTIMGGSGRVPPKDPSREREFGTEGVLGTKFEPADFFGKIHKGENVLNPEDAKKWAKLGGGEGVDKLFSSLQGMKSPMEKNVSSMFENMSSANNANVPMTKDLFSNLKTQISSLGTEISGSKAETGTPEVPTPAPEVASASSAKPADSTSTDMLTALNELNKTMNHLVALQGENNNIAEGMTRKIGSSNRFEA